MTKQEKELIYQAKLYIKAEELTKNLCEAQWFRGVYLDISSQIIIIRTIYKSMLDNNYDLKES